jgi:hypothetical protein
MEHYETVRLSKDGNLIDVSLSVSPLKGADGTVIGASKIARDITERKRAEEHAYAMPSWQERSLTQCKDRSAFRARPSCLQDESRDGSLTFAADHRFWDGYREMG